MKAFRATYTPVRWAISGDFDGYDKSKTDRVLVLIIKIYDRETTPDVVFIHSNGTLDTAPMHCFSECQWEANND